MRTSIITFYVSPKQNKISTQILMNIIGEVLRVLQGTDGRSGCVYEVKYEGEDEPNEVDHLLQDLKAQQVKILRS